MNHSSIVRIGIIGFGSMGHAHFNALQTLPDFQITALCDIQTDKLGEYQEKLYCASDYHKFLSEAPVDAVTIATPHWLHPEIAAAALDAGKHVLVEKPIGVHLKHAQILLDAIRRHPDLCAAAMFNQRMLPAHIKLKRLLDSGAAGKIFRINWIITDWFRTQRYYDSGDWRASWRGEGGGVLLNQCPHQLDLWQWFFGLPERLNAFTHFGRYHHIEVEDEVTAYMEYASGATGVFITSTGEAPGTNRLEIAAENGRIVLTAGKLEFLRNEVSAQEFSRTSADRFGVPEHWEINIPFASGTQNNMHRAVLENFGAAIRRGSPLSSPAAEGIRALELGNAMLLSGLEHREVTLPLDHELLARHFERLVQKSVYPRPTVSAPDAGEDFAASFQH